MPTASGSHCGSHCESHARRIALEVRSLRDALACLIGAVAASWFTRYSVWISVAALVALLAAAAFAVTAPRR